MKKITLLMFSIFFAGTGAKAQAVQNITIDIGGTHSTDSVNKSHMLGVIAGPAPNYMSIAPDLTTKFQDIGVTTIRNNDYFDDRLDMERMFFCGNYAAISNTATPYPDWNCDPNNLANYHFAESDIQFQNWVNGAFVPFFRLGGENSHPINQHDYKGPRSFEEVNWIKAGLRVVSRYNSFNNGVNTLQGYLNLWTEYPQMLFWDRDSLEFTNFWCNALDSLKNNFPSLKIGGPGFNTSISTALGNTPNGTVNTHIKLLLTELKQRNVKPGWIGFHVFSNDIDDFYKTSLAFRNLLKSEGTFTAQAPVWGSGNSSFFNGVELICDAWGFENDQSLPASTRDSLFNRQRGAAHHTGAFIAFQHADIERAYIYRGGEFGADTTLGVMGLFHGNANGSYKPAAYGFKLCSKMQTLYNKKLVSPVSALASGGSKIWTLAGKDISGNKAILISNPTANTINLSLTLNNVNLSTSLYPYIYQYYVTDLSNGTTANPWTSGSFVLPPYTSHLITMSNSAIGIAETTGNNKSLLLYPNPVNELLNFSETLNDIKIVDVYGQLVMHKTEAVKSISTRDLVEGIYFIQAGTFKMKFIVKH